MMNAISFQGQFHISIYRYYGPKVKNSIFGCLGLQKRQERSHIPFYNLEIIFSCFKAYGTQNHWLELMVSKKNILKPIQQVKIYEQKCVKI